MSLFGDEVPAPPKPSPPSGVPRWLRWHAPTRRQAEGARCDVCVRRLDAQWGTGVAYVPARLPVWRRLYAGTTTYLCEVCGADAYRRDRERWPALR